MTPRALVGPVLALLPSEAGAIAVVGGDDVGWRSVFVAAGWQVTTAGPVAAGLVSFLADRRDAAVRAGLLGSVRDRLAPDGRLVVVDHNRPRRPLARLAAMPSLWCRGLPAARASYPTAREVAATGFVVERLRLAAGERVQLVLARLRPAADLRTA